MKNNIYLFAFLFIVLSAGCKKEDDDDSKSNTPNDALVAPVVCFSVDTTTTNDSTHIFTFTSCSQNASRFEWDFGDGGYSVITNPTHVYNKTGMFNVRLTAYSSDGTPATISKSITIGNWYYSLTKVVFQKLSGKFALPTYLLVDMQSNPFAYLQDTVKVISQIPLTHILPDSSIYDFQNQVTFDYSEADNSTGQTNSFLVNGSQIINNMVSADVILFPDTAKLSMYFKVVHR